MKKSRGISGVASEMGKPTMTRYGNERPAMRRMPFGLGDAPDPSVYAKCASCGIGSLPVVEEVVWTVPLPLTDAEIDTTFGDTVNVLTSQATIAGVASIDTTFAVNGILSCDLFLRGLGLQVFAEPQQFTALGNGWNAPASPGCAPPSPDVWTQWDKVNGALGPGVAKDTSNDFVPADLWWGGETWRAGWHFMNAYQFQFKNCSKEIILLQQAADISYFGSFADAEASGTSEVPIIEYAAITNAIYRSKFPEGDCAKIFLPANFRRYGSLGGCTSSTNSNLGLFHPTRDYDFAPTTWGGINWNGNGSNKPYLELDNPCYLERGVPITMQFLANDPVHHALMAQAMSATSSTASCNISVDANVNCFTCGTCNDNVMNEQTLDSQATVIGQQVNTCRQIFKGGILKLAVKLIGMENGSAPWKDWCKVNHPELFTVKAGG